jgi:hypothetical protein
MIVVIFLSNTKLLRFLNTWRLSASNPLGLLVITRENVALSAYFACRAFCAASSIKAATSFGWEM